MARRFSRPEAGRRVRHLLADDRRDDAREQLDAEATRERRSVAAAVAANREPTHDVGLVREHRRENRGELRRIVLPVPVDLHRQVVAALEREPEPGLNGAADPEVEREPQNVGAAVRLRSRPSGPPSRRRPRRCRSPGRTLESRRSRDRPFPPRSTPGRSRCASARPAARAPRRAAERHLCELSHRLPPGSRRR